MGLFEFPAVSACSQLNITEVLRQDTPVAYPLITTYSSRPYLRSSKFDMTEIDQLLERIRAFAIERDWEKFHSPKNISMALAAEVAELLEHFQWMTESESRNTDSRQRAEIADEAADVFLYLLRLCDEIDIDLIKAANKKIDKNAIKYPVEKSKGRSTKYTKL